MVAFEVQIDYGKSTQAFIDELRAGGLYDVDPRVSVATFRSEKPAVEVHRFVVVRPKVLLGPQVDAKQIQQLLRRNKLRHATHIELLAVALAARDERLKEKIVQLGSIGRLPDGTAVVTSFQTVYCRFIGVRSPPSMTEVENFLAAGGKGDLCLVV